MMSKAEFHRALRELMNLDETDMPILMAGRMQAMFEKDPAGWFVRLGDEDADKVWAVIASRAAKGQS